MSTIIRVAVCYVAWHLPGLICLSALAQTPIRSLDRWMAAHTPEKIFLQTDKPYYAIGDTIWLSAFVVDGIEHSPMGISQVGYAQLINKAGDLIAQRVLRLTVGRGQADIALPDSLPEGDYQLVAFTNWMRNEPEGYFYHQNLHLWRTSPTAPKRPALRLPPDLQFFPEGGHLVAGIPCRVAFKILNSQGQPQAVEGTIVDNTGQNVAIPFHTTHKGMGLFFLTPQAGKQYRAKLPDGSTYPLPTVQPEGIGFWVDNLPDQRVVRVTVYNPTTASVGENRLLAHLRCRVCFEAIVPHSLRSTALIPYDKIPMDGLLTLTLFDQQQQPRCERLVLINQHRQLHITAIFDKPEYRPHEPIRLKLAVADSAGRPVAADLALSVTDADKVALVTGRADNLVANLLLTSDLAGYIDDPAAYFDPTNPYAARDADLLLMTQGWRRFVWQQPGPPPVFAREEGLTVTGRVLRLNNNSPLPSGQVAMILSAGSDSRFANVAVDSAGKFAITDVDLTGSIDIVAKGLNQTGKQARSLVLNPLMTFRAGYQTPPVTDSLMIPTLFLQAEQERAKVAEMFRFTSGRTLQGVEVKDKRGLAYWRDPRRSKLGEPDAVAKQGNLPANNFLDILRQSREGNLIYAKIIMGTAPVFIYVDGVTLTQDAPYVYASDPILLAGIVPADIAQIDIITNSAKMGVLPNTTQAFGTSRPALINILTKRGDYSINVVPNNSLARQTTGYSPVREFYVPKYAPETPVDPTHPDSRTTLFWAPHLMTDANGQATVTFPNSDHTARLRAVINGLSMDGRAGSLQIESLGKE